MRLRGLIRWDLVQGDRRLAVVPVLATAALVVLVHAMNRVDTVARAELRDPLAAQFERAFDQPSTRDALFDDHPDRSLDVAATFTKNADGTYEVHVTETLTLHPGDPIVEPIRTGDLDLSDSSELFGIIRLGDDWYPSTQLDSSPVQFVQSGVHIQLIENRSGKVTTREAQFLRISSAYAIDAQHITVTTADLAVEAVHGVVPIAQDPHSVTATLDLAATTYFADSYLAIKFSPIATTRFEPHYGHITQFPLSTVVFGLPLILFATASRVTIPVLRRLRSVLLPAFGVLVWALFGPPTAAISVGLRYDDLLGSLALTVLPIALWLGLLAIQGADVFAGLFTWFPAAAAAGGGVLILAALTGPGLSFASSMALLGSVAVIALLTAVIGRVLHPRALALGAALGALFTVGAFAAVLLDLPLRFIEFRGYGPWESLAAAVLWIPAALAFTWIVSKRRSWRCLVCAALVPLLTYMPIQALPVPHLEWASESNTLRILNAVSIAALMLLWRIGDDRSAYADPWSRRLAVAVVMMSYNAFAINIPAEPTLMAGILAALLLPRSRIGHAVDLGAIDGSGHREHMEYEIRRRLLRASESDYLRTAREKLASGELSAGAFKKGFARFRPSGPSTRASVELALGSPAGSTPWRNGVTAGMYGLLVAVPTVVLLDPGLPNLHALQRSLHYAGLDSPFATLFSVFRWVSFAFLYGYFYPRLPGRTAVAKAGWVTIAILMPRLADVLVYNPPYTGSLAISALVATAQCLVFGLSLGLLWEMRLARLADVPWTRVRNIRSLKAVAVPVTTISVAAAVAAATALTNYAMAPITTPPKPSGSVSSPAQSPSQLGPQNAQNHNEVAPPTDGATR